MDIQKYLLTWEEYNEIEFSTPYSVFVVYGSGHAIIQERSLKNLAI